MKNQHIQPSPPLRDDIAKRLRALQRIAGVTDQQMANYVGMSRGAWVNATREGVDGKKVNKPPEEAMVRLCERANLTMDWIYLGVLEKVPYKLAILLQEELTEPGSVPKGSMFLPGLLESA
jgi:hypothetical protein